MERRKDLGTETVAIMLKPISRNRRKRLPRRAEWEGDLQGSTEGQEQKAGTVQTMQGYVAKMDGFK